MRRKPVTILASALFALVMASPVIAAGSDDDPDTAPSATSTTTVTSDDNPSDDNPSDDPTSDDPNADDPNADDPTTGDPPSDDPDSDDSNTGDDTTASSTTTSTTAPSGSSSDPPTTATTTPGSSSSTCETPETLHEPAPKDGETVAYDAGEAGTVELSRLSQNALQVVSTKANDGWVAEVKADKGSPVKVRFVKDDGAGNKAKTRFAATLDQAGEEIHIRVTDCP